MAPAGNTESLRAAVNNGADAVYLGARDFSARSKAGNFNREELTAAIKYAHLFGVKVYLAINTVLKPSEYAEARELAEFAAAAGIDAFIVQDLMFIDVLHSTVQNVEIHLSTQAGVHNAYGASVAKQIGASRVVLSRETTLADIRKIRETVDIELEYFVQGALCVAFSGNCYLSSLGAGLSGNRGKCLQFCRKKYSCNGMSGYLLSAKDLNLSSKLDELIGLGVTSFKIEGRMRKPEYVGGVTAYYRAVLDGERADETIVKKLFNRGDYCAAYLDDPTENVIYPDIQGHKGLKIGNVASTRGNIATLTLKKPLDKGDGIKFVRENKETGSALVSARGFSTTFSGNVKSGDEVRLTTDATLEAKIRAATRKLPVSVALSSTDDELISVATCGNVRVTTKEKILEPARNAPLSAEKYERCFEKTGDNFALAEFNCAIENKFVPVSVLNDFRRRVYLALENKILSEYDEARKLTTHSTMQNYENLKTVMDGVRDLRFGERAVIIQTDRPDAEKFLEYADCVAYFPKDYSTAVPTLEKLGEKGMLVLPVMIRDRDERVIADCVSATDRVMINNVSHIGLCHGKSAVFGPFMNVVNPDFPFSAVLSPEYDGKYFGDKFAYAFGRFAAMTFAHCPNKTLNDGKCLGEGCDFRRKNKVFTDENGNEFVVRNYRVHYCYAQLLNCVPINILDKDEETGIKRKFIDFTDYPTEEALTVLRGKTNVSSFTRGYFRRKLS